MGEYLLFLKRLSIEVMVKKDMVEGGKDVALDDINNHEEAFLD